MCSILAAGIFTYLIRRIGTVHVDNTATAIAVTVTIILCIAGPAVDCVTRILGFIATSAACLIVIVNRAEAAICQGIADIGIQIAFKFRIWIAHRNFFAGGIARQGAQTKARPFHGNIIASHVTVSAILDNNFINIISIIGVITDCGAIGRRIASATGADSVRIALIAFGVAGAVDFIFAGGAIAGLGIVGNAGAVVADRLGGVGAVIIRRALVNRARRHAGIGNAGAVVADGLGGVGAVGVGGALGDRAGRHTRIVNAFVVGAADLAIGALGVGGAFLRGGLFFVATAGAEGDQAHRGQTSDQKISHVLLLNPRRDAAQFGVQGFATKSPTKPLLRPPPARA